MLPYKPQHINVTPQDIYGNNGLGRYILLTGSEQRAAQIGSMLISETKTIAHPRQHNFYMGKLLDNNGQLIDVGVISTGMGGPSADIIINELIMLGANRYLRVGTAGSLQPQSIRVGNIVIATGAVRDDKTSWDYIYKEYPALASIEYIIAAQQVLKRMPFKFNCHFGIVHSKSSLYAREFSFSTLPENKEYMNTMRESDVLASEMECAQLFILCSLMNARFKKTNKKFFKILCGCILAIVGDDTAFSTDSKKTHESIEQAIQLSFEVTKEMNVVDKQIFNL